ncbi:MAG TPA: ABC transporter permease [Parafilimonas sp.]|nr:ABC transporter permease [Parafilimonas sp.]
MFKNYFKTAWRNLLKDKQFSLLNLLGLSTGLACVLLIYLWVSDELSVDKFNANDSRLYQVIKTAPGADGSISTYLTTPGLLGQSMQNELPEVRYATVVRAEEFDERAGIISINDKRFKANFEFIDQNFFKVFSYTIIDGNANEFASNKYGVLLSDKMALKLFSTTQNLTGKTIGWNSGEFTGSYIVSGVFKSPPANATDQFDLMFNYKMYQSKESQDLANWGSNNQYTYLLLKKGTDVDAFNKKIKDFTKEKIKQFYPGDKGLLHWEGDIFVQKYSDGYLHGNYVNGKISGGRIEYVKLFSVIAIFILVIACINFMNLSTAKASRRMKEVGIKKVVGASKGSLILQYIGESILMAFASLMIALLLVELLLPAFRGITGKDITLQLNANLILSVIAITIITGLIAGSYPALYLSHFKPVSILKGKLIASSGESFIRKGLVVFQFTISVVLIVSVLVVYQQMKLIQTTNLGFNKSNVIRFSNDGNLKNNISPFLAEVKTLPGVMNATTESGDFFGQASHGGSGIDWDGKDPNLGIEYYGNDVGDDFFETMDLHIAEGRSFSKAFADSSSVIFNEAAIKAMGLKNPVGKTVSLWGEKKQIVGIVKDYHFKSLYDKITPSFLVYNPNADYTLVRIKAGNEKQDITGIKNLFAKFNNGLEFNYSFLDDDYNKLYASEQRVSTLSKYFAGIAILISCLGLFGLAAFTAQKRQKEIGIRKVVGASVTNVVTMLSKDFLVLVSISLLIAIPLSWWLMNSWLQGFAYRIHISPLVFLMAGFSVALITLITISFQSIKAAVANPVKSLRTE